MARKENQKPIFPQTLSLPGSGYLRDILRENENDEATAMYHKAGWDDPEKQMYLRYGGDGIADMIVGSAFLGIGLMLLSDMPFMPVWLVIFLAPISWGLKRWITVPRLSEAEAKKLQKEEGPAIQTIRWVAIAGVIFLAATVLITASSPGSLTAFLAPFMSWGLIGVSLASVLIIVGLINQARRFAAYALLVIPAILLIGANSVEFPAALAVLGVIIFMGGLVVAVRFVAGHPVVKT